MRHVTCGTRYEATVQTRDCLHPGLPTRDPPGTRPRLDRPRCAASREQRRRASSRDCCQSLAPLAPPLQPLYSLPYSLSTPSYSLPYSLSTPSPTPSLLPFYSLPYSLSTPFLLPLYSLP
jgi:hypothetical protein